MGAREARVGTQQVHPALWGSAAMIKEAAVVPEALIRPREHRVQQNQLVEEAPVARYQRAERAAMLAPAERADLPAGVEMAALAVQHRVVAQVAESSCPSTFRCANTCSTTSK
jgi:hypothetical protein